MWGVLRTGGKGCHERGLLMGSLTVGGIIRRGVVVVQRVGSYCFPLAGVVYLSCVSERVCVCVFIFS